jgi:hypothetical protein
MGRALSGAIDRNGLDRGAWVRHGLSVPHRRWRSTEQHEPRYLQGGHRDDPHRLGLIGPRALFPASFALRPIVAAKVAS